MKQDQVNEHENCWRNKEEEQCMKFSMGCPCQNPILLCPCPKIQKFGRVNSCHMAQPCQVHKLRAYINLLPLFKQPSGVIK